jgi:hypothetical protein
VVEGACGIGKSEFLARVCAEAAVRGVVPLAVRGNQRSRTMAFGAARTLLARWVADRNAAEQDTLFAGAAAPARIPLGLPHPDHTGTATMIGLTEALYWLVVAATSVLDSRDTALLLAVDDAHWLDAESLGWLEFLGDRITGLPVVLLLAYRPHEPGLAPELTRIVLRANEVVRPRALSRHAVRTIVGRGLGQRGESREPDDRFCTAFLRRSGGNPFYLRWMIDLARERGLAPTASAAGEVARLTPGPTIDFCHPIIRSAVYDDLSPSARSDIHRAAARLLDDRGCGPDTVATHLLDVHAAADPWMVDRLTAAAATAMRSGLSATAARYLERAVAEPPAAELLGHVRLRYGQALAIGEVAAALPGLA